MTKATTKPAATETTFEITEEDILARTEAAILAVADIFVDNVTTDAESTARSCLSPRTGFTTSRTGW